MREIKPINNHCSIQLRFSLSGTRYSFNPVPAGNYNNRRDLATANAIAIRIQNDILAGCFDSTLQKYRLSPKPETKHKCLLDIYDAWLDSLAISDATRANHYHVIRRMLEKAQPTIEQTNWLVDAKLAPATYNKRLRYIQRCLEWATTNNMAVNDLFASLKPRKATIVPIKPFSLQEITAILSAVDRQSPSYSSFVRFLFMTGCRLSEAIGLTRSHIDFTRNELTISESLSTDRIGNGYRRVRKSTKTGSIRTLAMHSQLRQLLLDACQGLGSDTELVFKSSAGSHIDDDNFRSRIWQQALKVAEVPYRSPHKIRHTVLSVAVEQGTSLAGVAYIAGHKDISMVVKTYGHMIHRPQLPDIL